MIRHFLFLSFSAALAIACFCPPSYPTRSCACSGGGYTEGGYPSYSQQTGNGYGTGQTQRIYYQQPIPIGPPRPIGQLGGIPDLRSYPRFNGYHVNAGSGRGYAAPPRVARPYGPSPIMTPQAYVTRPRVSNYVAPPQNEIILTPPRVVHTSYVAPHSGCGGCSTGGGSSYPSAPRQLVEPRPPPVFDVIDSSEDPDKSLVISDRHPTLVTESPLLVDVEPEEDEFAVIDPTRPKYGDRVKYRTTNSNEVYEEVLGPLIPLDASQTTRAPDPGTTTRIVPIPRKKGQSEDYEYYFVYYDDDDKKHRDKSQGNSLNGAKQDIVTETGSSDYDFDDQEGSNSNSVDLNGYKKKLAQAVNAESVVKNNTDNRYEYEYYEVEVPEDEWDIMPTTAPTTTTTSTTTMSTTTALPDHKATAARQPEYLWEDVTSSSGYDYTVAPDPGYSPVDTTTVLSYDPLDAEQIGYKGRIARVLRNSHNRYDKLRRIHSN